MGLLGAGERLWMRVLKLLQRSVELIRELELLVLPLACAGCDFPDVEVCQTCFAAMCAHPYLVLEDRLPIFGGAQFVGTNRNLVARWKDHGRAGVSPFVVDSARLSSLGLIEQVLRFHTLWDPIAGKQFPQADENKLPAMNARRTNRACITPLQELNICLVPMPSSGSATRARGFLPAMIVAQGVAKAVREDQLNGALPASLKINLRLIAGLKVLRNKADQSELGVRARRVNIRGKIHVSHELKLAADNSDLVLLIDDVVTTGATINEAHKEISRATRTLVAGFSMFVTPRTMPLAKSDLIAKKQPPLK